MLVSHCGGLDDDDVVACVKCDSLAADQHMLTVCGVLNHGCPAGPMGAC